MVRFNVRHCDRWMQSDNDDILYELFDDWAGTLAHNPYTLMFYRTIKRDFPETIFHGVDVGHQYYSTGKRFLQYLRDNDLQGTEREALTLEAIEQGKNHRRANGHGFRVTAMAENFIRTFDKLGGQNVMGIFGTAHTSLGFYSYSITRLLDVPTLAQRLRERYGDSVHTTDLWLWSLSTPIRADVITINGVDYEASYFGTNFTAFGDIVSMSFWRLENAYDDFSGKPANGDWLPFDNYPMIIELNQVFIVDAAFADGSVLRLFYRSDGEYWQDMPITTGFNAD